MIQIHRYPPHTLWQQLMQRPIIDHSQLYAQVADIARAVQLEGDSALHRFNQKWDNYSGPLRISSEQIARAHQQLPHTLWCAIQQAYANIHTFHRMQAEAMQPVQTMPGVSCWRRSVGIERVGIYIPGGSAPLFSTVLMLGVPAQIAGCSQIVLCTPATNGQIHPAVLASAHLCGIKEVYAVGGAQAIAAMAYGTESIPQVYKVFGPGNQYVTAAKQYLSSHGLIAIDLPAGPSEVTIWADEQAPPEFVAADLLSQAEHGPDSQVVLISESEKLIQTSLQALEQQLNTLPRAQTARAALQHSHAIVLEPEAALQWINAYAPEHLIVARHDAHIYAERITNAGSVFMGYYTPESAGDYASGTNHTLPTNGYARMYSGVSLDSFVKKITFQAITPEGLQALGQTITEMAAAEGLEAHRLAVDIRLQHLNKPNP